MEPFFAASIDQGGDLDSESFAYSGHTISHFVTQFYTFPIMDHR